MKHAERLSTVRQELKNFAIALDARVKTELTGYDLLVVFGYRSLAEQEALYAQGRTKPGSIVTNAKPGSSPHNYNAAIDVWLSKGSSIDWSTSSPTNKKFMAIIKELVAKTNGVLTWGGNFNSLKDYPHIEWTNWRTLRK